MSDELDLYSFELMMRSQVRRLRELKVEKLARNSADWYAADP